VAWGGLAQPPCWFQLSAFSISAFAQVWLCPAVQGSKFEVQGSGPRLMLDVPFSPLDVQGSQLVLVWALVKEVVE
jgi:hypothetical protein